MSLAEWVVAAARRAALTSFPGRPAHHRAVRDARARSDECAWSAPSRPLRPRPQRPLRTSARPSQSVGQPRKLNPGARTSGANPPAASCRCYIHPPTRRRHQIPIAPAAPPAPNFPRLRALALFGRRLPQRVDSLVMPASENLHRSGHRKTIFAANARFKDAKLW